VLPNGRIVYTRWEHNIDDNEFDLYSVNPTAPTWSAVRRV
jgi:hypothetical protein